MYHALGYTSIVFIKAMMTCDKVGIKKFDNSSYSFQADMERAMQICKSACTVIERYRQKLSLSESLSLYSFGGKQKQLTDGLFVKKAEMAKKFDYIQIKSPKWQSVN